MSGGAGTVECPRCKLLNQAEARRCDCGYDLVKRPAIEPSPTVGVANLLFSLRGRIDRYSYWVKFFVPYMAITVVLTVVDVMLGTFDSKANVGVLSVIFMVLAIYPSIAVSVKRAHDRDRSGWFVLLGLVPLVNLWVVVELGFLAGTPGANTYGFPNQAWE